ncbi:MAG: hypothetical protein LUD78_07060 [Clostridiales bacterium]|nr:hypothetical protein [Clostridiales bacterium]
MKKLLSLLLALAMVLSLAACGSTTTSTTDDDTTDTSAAGETDASATYTGTIIALTLESITITTDDEEEVEIPYSEDTTFAREGGGGDMASGGGSAPDGEVPSGDSANSDSADSNDSTEANTATENSGPVLSETSSETTDDNSEESGEVPDDLPDGEGGEMPSGEGGEVPSDVGGDGGEAPSDAGGDGGSMPSDMGGGMSETLTYQDLSLGDAVTIVVGSDGVAESVTITTDSDAAAGGDMGGDSSQSSGEVEYSAANEYTEDASVSDAELTSTGTDENAVLVDTEGVTVELDNVTITRTSDDSTGGDNSSFYGVGAAALAALGTLTIEDSIITTNAAGGAGVFAYGDGVVYVSDTTITTQQDTSGGIHVAGGGTLYAWDLTVETSGESSAAIRSDRGSGTMVVDGGSYTSNGTGSPAVYSTADITVNDATLTATGSEAICIEGLNTIRLFDCDLSGAMADSDQNDCTWNVILYQSMSGDSEEGNSTFEMVGGSLTAANGGMFYTTNTESTFIISGVDITYAEDNDFLLKCTGNSNARGWGSAGSNGADCNFTAIDQALEGDVIWDTISQLDFYLTEGSTLTGAVVDDESNAGDGGSGYANLYIDSTSTWVVTGDSVLTELQCAGTIVDESGNTVSIVGSDGTVYVEGASAYTVTVESYSDSADVSGASSVDAWEEFQVEEP